MSSINTCSSAGCYYMSEPSKEINEKDRSEKDSPEKDSLDLVQSVIDHVLGLLKRFNIQAEADPKSRIITILNSSKMSRSQLHKAIRGNGKGPYDYDVYGLYPARIDERDRFGNLQFRLCSYDWEQFVDHKISRLERDGWLEAWAAPSGSGSDNWSTAKLASPLLPSFVAMAPDRLSLATPQIEASSPVSDKAVKLQGCFED